MNNTDKYRVLSTEYFPLISSHLSPPIPSSSLLFPHLPSSFLLFPPLSSPFLHSPLTRYLDRNFSLSMLHDGLLSAKSQSQGQSQGIHHPGDFAVEHHMSADDAAAAVELSRLWYVLDPSYYTLYIPFIHRHYHIHTYVRLLYTCIYTIHTPNTPLNTLYTP